MIFEKINIANELKASRSKSESLMDEAKKVLNNSAKRDMEILSRINRNEGGDKKNLELSAADSLNVFLFSDIKNVCIDYRLRFLDSNYFKQTIPYEAVIKIKQFEDCYNYKITRFKVIAPASVFDLQDANQDPLLFAQLSDEKYYLIHKWGNDLAWYRKFLYLPIRSIYSYFYSIIIAAALFAFSIPFSWLQVQLDNEIYMRVWFTLHCTIGFFFFILFIGAVSQATFNNMSWNSRYNNE